MGFIGTFDIFYNTKLFLYHNNVYHTIPKTTNTKNIDINHPSQVTLILCSLSFSLSLTSFFVSLHYIIFFFLFSFFTST